MIQKHEWIYGRKQKRPPEVQRKIFWNISCPGSIRSLWVCVKYNTQLSLETLWVHHFAHCCHQSICPPYVFCFRLLYKAELPRVFCCPQLFSSFDPHLLSLSSRSLNFLHFGQLLSFAALLWAGKKILPMETGKIRKQDGLQVLCMCHGSLAAHCGVFQLLE